ncbi:hypothetical protein HYH02_007147 [Chlamydomonas schloesseri]|uniref:Mediator of RNA polymerase II transcription subunit 21 n=1 Tax=Chlamydomonas schloesseri TaxID=2026947 RepID=A0A835WHL3_9CHLO|nr:hypothetical protein HYH02_007147 [Chlamydomonas schloesseri]|eukprot:KAG2447687.1 hypothetical protein HYH02_007147 [Chlamydomonas schloesseri]
MSSDLLTDLQRQLRDLNDNFASVVEQLVHIAPPVPVGPDDTQPLSALPAAVPRAELQTKATELSQSLMQRFRDIDSLIDKLPELGEPPEQQDARIAGMLHEHQALRKELGVVMGEAEAKLDEVYGCYEALSNHVLAHEGKMGPGRDGDGNGL